MCVRQACLLTHGLCVCVPSPFEGDGDGDDDGDGAGSVTARRGGRDR